MNHEITAPDLTYLARALALARQGLYTTDPNPRVGCVLVKQGQIIAEGWHARAGEPHAEAIALRAAGPKAPGATAYVSLEPCGHTGRTPPCADALIGAGIARVVCCTEDPNPKVAGSGIERLRTSGIEVAVGALQKEARELNVGFFHRFEHGRPYIRLKMAMTLDARTAASAGGHGWISGEASRADVQHWRARSSAILTGAGTVRSDDPQLNVRLVYGPWVRQPLRVVLDTTLSCAPSSRIFAGDGALVFAAEDAAGVASQPPSTLVGVRQVEQVPRGKDGLDLGAVISCLAQRQVNELLVECGPHLAGAFIAENLIDELVLYIAPTLFGENAPPLAYLDRLGRSGAWPEYEFQNLERIGDDVRLILTAKKS
jgi:diaminohydroxyphosphoribosylaminopyrimidine deaminase/5-amino-6-(5-phosphoribosylamino)uracil reductase